MLESYITPFCWPIEIGSLLVALKRLPTFALIVSTISSKNNASGVEMRKRKKYEVFENILRASQFFSFLFYLFKCLSWIVLEFFMQYFGLPRTTQHFIDEEVFLNRFTLLPVYLRFFYFEIMEGCSVQAFILAVGLQKSFSYLRKSYYHRWSHSYRFHHAHDAYLVAYVLHLPRLPPWSSSALRIPDPSTRPPLFAERDISVLTTLVPTIR